jgi:hypothetical protein
MEQSDKVKLKILMAVIATIFENIECFASMADFLRPKKRMKVKDLSQ